MVCAWCGATITSECAWLRPIGALCSSCRDRWDAGNQPGRLLCADRVRDRARELREVFRADGRHDGHPHLEYRLTKSAFQVLLAEIESELSDLQRGFR